MCVVALVCLIHQGIAKAQYNKNFATYYPGSWAYFTTGSNTLDIVRSQANVQCALSEVTDLPPQEGFSSWDNLIHLKSITTWGSTMWDKFYRINDSFYKVEPWRIIKPQDSGYIIAGRSTSKMGKINPFAARFDSSGNFMWAKIYETNDRLFLDHRETSICRVDDPGNPEGFIILRSGSSTDTATHPNNVCVNALRIRGSDGALIWNNKYYSTSQTRFDSTLFSYPKTICHVPDTGGGYYFISGMHLSFNPNSGGDSLLFYMGIDRNGNVVHNYKTIDLGGAGPNHHDAVFDASENSIIMSYTFEHSPYMLQYFSLSQIALMKFTVASVPYSLKYYAAYGFQNTNSARMTINTADDAYVIAANLRSSADEPNNIAQLKVEKNGSIPHFALYNFYSFTVANTILNVDPLTGDELYIIGGHKENGLSEERLLQTDPTGNTCGALYLYPVEDEMNTVDSTYRYNIVQYNRQLPISFWPVNIDISEDNCTDATYYTFKPGRPTENGIAESAKATKVYPTILESGDQIIHIETDKDYAGDVTVSLTSIDGRMIASTGITSGTKYDWQIPDIAPGYYVVTLRTANGKVLKNEKIVKI